MCFFYKGILIIILISQFNTLNFARGPAKEVRILKLAYQASPVGQSDQSTRVKRVELICQRRVLRQLYARHRLLENERLYEKEL